MIIALVFTQILALVFAFVILILLFVQFFFFLRILRLWLRAALAGTPVSLVTILSMRFRKTDARVIIDALIATNQAGCPVSCAELERAYLTGVDLDKVVLAYITAKKRDLDLSFEEVADADRESRLAEMLRDKGVT